jgi:hypothetical protein
MEKAMADQINTENLLDFSVEEDEPLTHALLDREQYDQLLNLWEKKGSRNWSRRTPKANGHRERVAFCRSLRNKEMIKAFVKYGTKSDAVRLEFFEALEETQFDPLYLLNCAGVSPFDVLYEIEAGQQDIADRRKLRLRLNNKEKRDSDITFFKKAVRRVRVYERLLNDEISEGYDRGWVRRGLINRTRNALPYSTTGRLNALCRMIDNYKETLMQLWRSDVIKNKSSLRKQGAPTKEEFRLAIAKVLGACSPLFKEDHESLTVNIETGSWRTKHIVLRMKWVLVTAILTYAFPKMFNDVTDTHRFRTVRQRLKNAERKNKKINPNIERQNKLQVQHAKRLKNTKRKPRTTKADIERLNKLKVQHAMRTVREQYRQQLSEWNKESSGEQLRLREATEKLGSAESQTAAGLVISPKDKPVRIAKVEGAAEEAGLKPGDILLEFNGREIVNRFSLFAAVLTADAEENFRLKVSRRGKELELSYPPMKPKESLGQAPQS